jgi:hypothetical protein
MHIQVPDNLVGERLLWNLLTNWHYFYQAPWESEDDMPKLDNPFYYDTHYASIDPSQQQEVILTFKGFPSPIMKRESQG